MMRRLWKSILGKTEKVSETASVEESIEESEPDFNKDLLDHFLNLPVKQYTPIKLYHGGAHVPGVAVKGTL